MRIAPETLLAVISSLGLAGTAPAPRLPAAAGAVLTAASGLPLPGDPAPAFRVDTTLGSRSLADSRGRWLILFAYPAGADPVSGSEVLALARAHGRFAALDVDLLGLSSDGLDALSTRVADLREREGVDVPFPLAADPALEVASAYGLVRKGAGALDVRALFVVDPGGIVRATLVYPPSTARSVDELLRLAAALRAPAHHDATAGGHGPAPMTHALEPYTCGTVQRLHTYAGVFLASQPSPEDLEQAKLGGVVTVVNLRHPGEQDFDERAVVEGLGLAYHQPAWNGVDELTDGMLDDLRGLLRDAPRPLLLHCASANRVGAVWLAYRLLDEDAPLDQALDEARRVGLKTPAYEARVLEYVEEQREAR